MEQDSIAARATQSCGFLALRPGRLAIALLVGLPMFSLAQEGGYLPESKPLTWQDDLADRMMDGLHRFSEQRIAQSVARRATFWKRDTSSTAAYDRSVQPNRERLQKLLGVVDARVPVRMERFGDDDNPALVAETERYRVFQVRWPVLEAVWGEGLLLEPKGKPNAWVVALPDADQTPEQLAGLTDGIIPDAQFARRLAENGFQVVVPALVDRSDRWSGNGITGWTNQPHREWLYRQAYHMGRHVIGYEVQRVLAVVEWFRQRAGEKAKIGIAGHGEGGLLAMVAAALDPRIDACLVSGYFEERSRPWEEPLYRNIWGLAREFGDAEIATLIAPRGLVVEYSKVPAVTGPPPVQPGRRAGGAVGKLVTPGFEAVQSEFQRIATMLPAGFQRRQLVAGRANQTTGPSSRPALQQLAQMLGTESSMEISDTLPRDQRQRLDLAGRQFRLVREVEHHVQRLIHIADQTRAEFMSVTPKPGPGALEQFVSDGAKYRKYLWDEVLGRIDEPLLPLNPRTRKIYDNPKWTGYEVVLDVFPDVFAWGVLLLPKDLKPGEKRPVVVCQHGRNGLPKDVIEGDHRAYHDYAAKLAERGFITFAPHNPYRGEDRYRILNRKANAVKATLFSLIAAQHQQILNWLETLPHVDAKRIAFYGLSYGGETAVRIPPLLERYCLSICSADFNHWTRKVASTETSFTFMNTIEWEMPYFNMGHTFDYAELAALMVPRPFMVERGHADGVAQDEWVAHEYAKVRRLYVQLGLGARTAIEFFEGPHTIHGKGTYDFLHRQLNWPTR